MPSVNNLPAPEPKHRRLAVFRRWHKWGGVTAGVFLLVAATSGIVLNYKRPIFSALGVEIDARGTRGSGEKSPQSETRVNQVATLTTSGGFTNAAVTLGQALAVARELWGDVPLERIELRADRGGLLYRIKERGGEEVQINATTGAHFVKGEYEKVKANAEGKVVARSADWGKIILDLHTGRIGGEVGKAVMSLAAVVLLLLTTSGVYMWIKPVLIRRQNARVKAEAMRSQHHAGPALATVIAAERDGGSAPATGSSAAHANAAATTHTNQQHDRTLTLT